MTKKLVAAQDKFMLRLPDGMREHIAKRAEENGRSMNSEIVQILHDAIHGGMSLSMDEDFSRVYQEMLEADDWDNDEAYYKIDYLTYLLMEKMEADSRKLKELLNVKKELINKKAP
ncbi:Arc-like DNA binding dprotein [Xenorhabdus cabanillasii]|uniref:Arc-like DNA binding dprotein n=1 Tax=Xenorhabdus cabanillasii TaxID=351673 RepID=A0A3D9UGS8_9GAMM|nr:Arc family DNA-binding protein [Xenorhabdus cabanillasii]REF28678.1 Arc-like DNA binding dprotein [Xenorhabdus cabanillasii]